jgi:hypothetical protein
MTTPINLLPPESTQCSSIARQSDGRLLLGGVTRRADTEFTPASQKSFAVRLMADGSQDTTFVPDLAGLSAVTALAVSSTGNVYAGGRDRSGQPGGVVLRLFAEGPLDPSFGRDGAAIVEPQTSVPGPADIRNIKVLANDALLVGGDGATACCAPRPFVARLLGDGAIGGPGVLGMTLGAMQAVQEGGQATLTVRRTGGSNGAISVGYATRGFGPSSEIAAPGDDYTLGAGRLSWGDGDTGERQIVIPISTDEFTEVPERFEVFLEAPEGGAGIGATASRVEIAGAGYPAGMFDVVADRTSAFEGAQVMFLVSRRYYSQGAVSVTLHIAASSSATPGDDFTNQGSTGAWTDVVLQWGDGDVSTKQVPVLLRRDDRGESAETLSVQLVSPAGGAAVGPAGETSVTIRDAVVPDQNSSRSGGGGGFGALGALMLGLTAALRRRGVRGR